MGSGALVVDDELEIALSGSVADDSEVPVDELVVEYPGEKDGDAE